jgi:DNA polymerase-3 subunit epsilon
MDAAEAGAAAAFDLPQDLVFVDLETTGGNAAHHRITEVGIVRMANGTVVDEWSSLVNPDCRIPSYIESFTGITNEMVAGAPRFAEIAALVLEKLRSPVFVAHNARFDYAFLRTEFRRVNVHFSAKVMCTVKLSRRLFPEYPRHSLDAVMERHRLTCTARHRALGDARVLGDFWSKLLDEIPEERLRAAAKIVIGANRLPAHLPADLADELPEGPGVYRFFGENDVLLYIGKSHSLRTRILGHFAAETSSSQERKAGPSSSQERKTELSSSQERKTEPSSSQEQKKARQTRRIDWVETAGDLGAQLTEAHWIKTQKPLYNKRLKLSEDSFTLQAADDGRSVAPKAIADVEPGRLDDCFGVFHSHKDARGALGEIARAHSLCLKTLGLENEDAAGSCLAYHGGKCRGACIAKEPLIVHGVRLMMALSALKLKSWPFPGRVALREGRSDYHVLDHWVYLGTARSEEELAELKAAPARAGFDADVYRILVRHLTKNPRVDWHDLSDTAANARAP